ncbi:hypothetical protein SMD44_07344 [Streptomyces alboflavus]|uniref:Uncharacterized protein n=2 Tax=Streptomyces alboflavus TaxID=67267 RepID=A0A1Z1WNF9_9ACTN|nr:hypothetical protein SMD44_07344 [Streptomyces alboflavus]
MSMEDIRCGIKVKRYQIEECAGVRPWNVRNADIGMFRMLTTELKRRGDGINELEGA